MIIDGRKIAGEVLAEIGRKIKILEQPLRLDAIMVEGDPAGKKFLEIKKETAREIGVDFKIHSLPADISSRRLREEINKIASIKSNSAIVVELPLPEHIKSQYILNAIPQNKDVDVLSEKSQGAFFVGRSAILPPAVEAVRMIFEKYSLTPAGKNCAVFGYGLLVGRPLSHWLSQMNASVSVINELTADARAISEKADIIISGVGKPGIIKGDMVKQGAVVLDFGLSYQNGRASGDADFDEVNKKASLITPAIGGMGPLVVAALFKNLIILNTRT